MKRVIFFAIILLKFIGYSQCKLKDYVPFNLGSSRLETTQLLNSLNPKPEENNGISTSNASWEKLRYIKNDSIYKVIINKKFYQTECFKGKDNRCQLYFSDDVLYKIVMFQEFSGDDFNEMINDYESIISIFDEVYKYSNETGIYNNNKEKIGKGIRFYKTQKNKIVNPKVKEGNVSYSATYKRNWNQYSKQYEISSEIDFYTIEIEMVDLSGTKLTNKGY